MSNRRSVVRCEGLQPFVRLALVVLLGDLFCKPTVAIFVRDAEPALAKPAISGVRGSQSSARDEPTGDAAGLEKPVCKVERPFLLDRSRNSMQLYQLDIAGLHRIQTDGVSITKTHVCTLPNRYEEAQTLQVLDIQLDRKDYVLFIVSTDQWHNVHLAHGNQSAEAASAATTIIHPAQPIQRIKYAGATSKAQLLECNENIYLVTIVTYANTGQIRVYRWVQSFFSLESTKEVASIDDMQCYCPGTLLLLALDYAVLPQRSMNHVLLVDETSGPVKVQEMFFLSSFLPSFMLESELYLVRHLSMDKSYLYQWNSEGRFVRTRKLSYKPGQITAVTHWDRTLAIAVEGMVHLYGSGQQHLLRVESPFTVPNTRQSEASTQLPLPSDTNGNQVRLFALATGSENELALAMAFSCSTPPDKHSQVNGTALKIHQLSVMSVARAAEAQEHGFKTLENSLHQLKHSLNERKKWIDLIRLQLSRKNLAFNALTQVGQGTSAMLEASVQVRSILVPHDSGSLTPPSRTVLNGQSLLLRHFRMATDLNQVLLLNRARTNILGDLHVAGNVRTRCSKIRAVNSVEDVRSDGTHRRQKRASSVHISHRTAHRVLKTREVISDTTLSQRFVQKSKMNVLTGTVQLDELNVGSVRLELGQINRITVPSRKALQDAASHGYRGHKEFGRVKSNRLNAHLFNGEPLAAQVIESSLRYSNDGITIKSDRCRSRNVLVRNTLNGISLERIVSTYQPVQYVKGNVLLAGPVCTKNMQYKRMLNEVTKAELLDRVTNQTITGPMFVSKGFTHHLQVERVNAEPLANYASTRAHQTVRQEAPPMSLLMKAPVRAEKMIVLGDLIANHAEQQFAPHIGTRPGDFRQHYRGKLLLNGSLRLKAAIINEPNITVMGQSVSSKPYQQFLMRTERQLLNRAPVTAYRTAQFQYLFVNTLNNIALWQFSLTHHSWQNHLYVQDATVWGHVRSVRISKRLHSIKRNRVALNAYVQLCDVRNFVGTLRVAHLRTHSIGGAFSTDMLVRKNSDQPQAAPMTLLGRTALLGSALKVRGPLRAHGFKGRTSYELPKLSTNSYRHFRTLQLMTVEAATVHILRSTTDALSLADFVLRFASITTQDSGGAVRGMGPWIAKIITAGEPQHIAAASVTSINFCAVDRLLQETVPKFAGAHVIEGNTRVQGSITIADRLGVAAIGSHKTALLEHVVTRGSVTPQIIEQHWRFGAIAASYLTAKALNRVYLSRFALRTDTSLLLQSELFVERLQVSSLQWPERAGWNFDNVISNGMASGAHQISTAVTMLRCYGIIYGLVRDPQHVVHELLLAPSADTVRLMNGLVIFDTQHVHFGNSTTTTELVWIERIAKNCLRQRTFTNDTTVVFEHEQILLAPGPIVVRGDLLAFDRSRLTSRTVDGVNVAERLGPNADVFRLPRAITPTPPQPIAGKKQFRHHVLANNVTLDGRNKPSFWYKLAFCSHPADPSCVGIVLHFGTVPIVVGQLLTTVQLNHLPLNGYFHAFSKRHSVPIQESKLHHIQDFLGTLTVTELQLDGFDTILHHINGIPLDEVVLRSTTNVTHQSVDAPKHFRTLRLGGPLSLEQLNDVSLAQLKETSLGSVTPAEPAGIEATIFSRPVLLTELQTRTLYHSRTASSSLTANSRNRQRQHSLTAMDLLQTPISGMARANGAVGPLSGRHRFNTNALTSSTPRKVASESTTAEEREKLLPLTGNTAIRAECSDDQQSLVIALMNRQRSTTGHGANRTIEQRLHDLSSPSSSLDAGCMEVVGYGSLNDTTLLIVLRRRNGHAAYWYDVPRGMTIPLPLPSAVDGSVCRCIRLLQPTGVRGELMLAIAGCTNATSDTVAVGRVVQIFRLDGLAQRFRHFQTISTGTPMSAMETTAHGATLILQDAATNQRHQYIYNSMKGWTRNDFDGHDMLLR